MKCEVVCHQLRGPQGLYDTYGLRLTETGDFYGDITLDKAQARRHRRLQRHWKRTDARHAMCPA